MKKRLLLIYAHPDDESFSLGGTLAKYKSKDVEVKLICATRGEAGSPGNPSLCRPWHLSEVRTNELKNAAKILGIRELFFLGLRDGTLTHFSTRFLSNLIYPILIDQNPQVVITFAETGISGHDDHIMISRAASIAFKKFLKGTKTKTKLYHSTVPQSIIEKMKDLGLIRQVFKKPVAGTDDHAVTTVVDIAKTFATKARAIECHKTQHQDWERYFKRTELGLTNKEYFVLIKTNIKHLKFPETDLFAGF